MTVQQTIKAMRYILLTWYTTLSIFIQPKFIQYNLSPGNNCYVSGKNQKKSALTLHKGAFCPVTNRNSYKRVSL